MDCGLGEQEDQDEAFWLLSSHSSLILGGGLGMKLTGPPPQTMGRVSGGQGLSLSGVFQKAPLLVGFFPKPLSMLTPCLKQGPGRRG